MRLRDVFYPILALALAGCTAFGACTFEDRSLEASGSVAESVTDSVFAQITLSENRGSLQGTMMQWIVSGPTLKGHVLSATFKDAADLSTPRLNLPLATADRLEISSGAADTRQGANLGGVHDLLAAGRGIVELQTDISARSTIRIPLAATLVGDWIRPNCS